MLSRFCTPKEQKRIFDGLKNGTIDIVIGTHKVLSKNIKYKNLGLLIIDEEQRFGVKQKEKIKQLKKDVDVLALSATPIPRTLHMSLAGITSGPPGNSDIRYGVQRGTCPRSNRTRTWQRRTGILCIQSSQQYRRSSSRLTTAFTKCHSRVCTRANGRAPA